MVLAEGNQYQNNQPPSLVQSIARVMVGYTLPQSSFFVDEFKVPEYRGSLSPEEESEKEEDLEFDIVDVSNDDDNENDSDWRSENDFSDPESYITNNEVDP